MQEIMKNDSLLSGFRGWRDRVAMGLMLLASVGALLSFVSCIGDVAGAGADTRIVEIWRMYGLGVFSGLFVLLAFFPRRYPGVWELVIVNKLALAVTGLVLLGSGTVGADLIVIGDGVVGVIVVLAYILSRGWMGWMGLHRK